MLEDLKSQIWNYREGECKLLVIIQVRPEILINSEGLKKIYSLIPSKYRLNLHAIYGDFGGKYFKQVQIAPEHFKGWIEWTKENDLKIDFNSTCFSHPMADSGFTLSSKNKSIRDFWIKHVKKAREISAFIVKNKVIPAFIIC